MTIRLIRHGQSYANIGEAQCDACLTSTGREQAKRLTGKYDLIIVSPMRRTKETFFYSDVRGGKVITSELCREMKQGISDLLLFEDEIFDDEHTFDNRMGKLIIHLHDLSKQYKNIAVFTHGHVIKHITNMNYYLDNTQSVTINFD